MSTADFDKKLRDYAHLAVHVGVGLRSGQRLIVRAPVESAPLVRRIAECAYKAGARLVEVLWTDDELTLARFRHAPRDSFEEFPTWRARAQLEAVDARDALLVVYGADPDLLEGQDPALVSLVTKVNQQQMAPVSRRISNDDTNWCVLGVPVTGWAAKVFPNEPESARVEKLWEAIFRVCRIDQPDPEGAWRKHLGQLAERGGHMTKKQFKALHYTAPGTDLTVGLPERHTWRSGLTTTPSGIAFTANIPTEEIWSMPHKDRVEGTVTGTKPLSHGGVLIDKIQLTFAAGRVVEARASSGEEVLRQLVATDEGSSRLGEVALVPHGSMVSKTGVLFYDTLYDENASCHFALGRAYRNCIENGQTMDDLQFAAAGGNSSLAHVDFMIGSAELNIEGVRHDGKKEPVMRAGEWAF